MLTKAVARAQMEIKCGPQKFSNTILINKILPYHQRHLFIIKLTILITSRYTIIYT